MKKHILRIIISSILLFSASFILLPEQANADAHSRPVKCKNYNENGEWTGNGNTCVAGTSYCIPGNECSGKPKN